MAGRSKFVTYVFPLVAVAALAGGIYSIVQNTPQRSLSDPAILPPMPSTKTATKQSFIGATGIVQPSSEEVNIGSHLSGVVTHVFVAVGDNVKSGDPLFVLDDREAKAELELQTLQANGIAARIRELQEGIPAAEARLEIAKADADDKRTQLALLTGAGDKGAVSKQDVLARRYALAGSEARVAEAKANLRLLKGADGQAPTIDVQRVQQEQFSAATAKAKAALDRHTVYAPLDAKVLQVNIRAGEFAQAGVLATPLVVLGVVDPLRVRVDIDESDIVRFNPKAPAFAALRGAAEKRAPLTFQRVEPLVVQKTSLTGTGTERVDTRVMQVIYLLSPADLPALSGQQVDVFIEVTSGQSASSELTNNLTKENP
jgi:HlyD family secretion protein